MVNAGQRGSVRPLRGFLLCSQIGPSESRDAEYLPVAGKTEGTQTPDLLHLAAGKRDADRSHAHRFASCCIVRKKIVAGLARGFHDDQMSEGKRGVTVRFEDDEMAELERLAKRYRVSFATIIRWALHALAEHVGRNEGRLILPVELERQFDIKLIGKGAEPATRKAKEKTS